MREYGTVHKKAAGASHLCSLSGRGLFAQLFWFPVSLQPDSDSVAYSQGLQCWETYFPVILQVM